MFRRTASTENTTSERVNHGLAATAASATARVSGTVPNPSNSPPNRAKSSV